MNCMTPLSFVHESDFSAHPQSIHLLPAAAAESFCLDSSTMHLRHSHCLSSRLTVCHSTSVTDQVVLLFQILAALVHRASAYSWLFLLILAGHDCLPFRAHRPSTHFLGQQRILTLSALWQRPLMVHERSDGNPYYRSPLKCTYLSLHGLNVSKSPASLRSHT